MGISVWLAGVITSVPRIGILSSKEGHGNLDSVFMNVFSGLIQKHVSAETLETGANIGNSSFIWSNSDRFIGWTKENSTEILPANKVDEWRAERNWSLKRRDELQDAAWGTPQGSEERQIAERALSQYQDSDPMDAAGYTMLVKDWRGFLENMKVPVLPALKVSDSLLHGLKA